jgi:hypothetical protein
MKIFYLLTLNFMFSLCNSQTLKIEKESLRCISKDSVKYISFSNENKITFYIESGLCDLVENKNLNEENILKKEKLYIKINEKYFSINSAKNYTNSLPNRLYQDNNTILLELNIVSHIGINGNDYILVEIDKNNNLLYTEFDSKIVLNLKNAVKNKTNQKKSLANYIDSL